MLEQNGFLFLVVFDFLYIYIHIFMVVLNFLNMLGRINYTSDVGSLQFLNIGSGIIIVARVYIPILSLFKIATIQVID